MCREWDRFESFRDWALASGYQDNLTIDRKDNDGNYEPSNCQWITNTENVRKGHFQRKRRTGALARKS